MRLVISLMMLSFFLTACGLLAPQVGTAGQLVEWTDTRCSEALDGQRLALEGFFSLGDSFSEQSNGTAYVELRDELPEGTMIVFAIPVGEGAGQVKAPPIVYSLDDLALQTSAGEMLQYGDAARISFTVKYNGLNASGNPSCQYQAPYLIEGLGTGSASEATEEAGD